MIVCEVSTNPQARAWRPSSPVARSWLPMTTTCTAWAPLPVTDPAEVWSHPTPWKPSQPHPPVSPKLTQVTGGRASFSGSPLSRSWPLWWNPQSIQNLLRPPAARSPVTWLRKPQRSPLAASPAKSTSGLHPKWPPAATRLSEVLGSFELLPLPSCRVPSPYSPHPGHQAGRSSPSWVPLDQNTKKEVERAPLFTTQATLQPS